MTNTNAALIRTDCSACRIDLEVRVGAGTVAALIPSNGKRGSLHAPAHAAVVEFVTDGDDDPADPATLLMWDCPACGYADSLDRLT